MRLGSGCHVFTCRAGTTTSQKVAGFRCDKENSSICWETLLCVHRACVLVGAPGAGCLTHVAQYNLCTDVALTYVCISPTAVASVSCVSPLQQYVLPACGFLLVHTIYLSCLLAPRSLSYESRAPLAKCAAAKRCLEVMARKHTNLSVAADVETAEQMLALAEQVGVDTLHSWIH